MSMASQLREANLDTFPGKHEGQASTALQLNQGNVETLAAGHSGRMSSLSQQREGNTDIVFTNNADYATPLFQFRRRNEKTFADDERVSLNLPLTDRNRDTFPQNHEGQAFTRLQLKERNFHMNHEGQMSTVSQVKGENMATSLAEHGREVLRRPPVKEGSMDTHPLEHGGQVIQYMKRGIYFYKYFLQT